MDEKLKIEELLMSISNNEKYKERVFWKTGIFFVVGNGSLWEIPDDASCSPKGGWFPDIVVGSTKEEKVCLQEMMDELGFDEYFFSEVIGSYDEFDDEYVMEYFNESEDEESAKIYHAMKKKVESGKTPFATFDDFVNAVGRYRLDSDRLYYEWEGEYIDFHDNICETGELRGCYDNLTDNEWIEILENIDKHIVSPD